MIEIMTVMLIAVVGGIVGGLVACVLWFLGIIYND